MNPWRAKAWSPYVVGALLGVLSWFAFVSADKPLGVSTTFVTAVSLAEQTVAPAHVVANEYLAKKTTIDWQFLLVIGIFLGALTSAWLSGDRQVEQVPELWRRRFGDSRLLRYAAAFAGGAILMFGARLAGGCTSGHGLSGGLQLALSGWTFFLALFASGVATAMALFHKERSHV